MKPKKNYNIEIVNRRASHEYSFAQRFTAGMILTGTEVKSIRTGRANLTDAFCYIENGEIFIKNMKISEYEFGTYNNHDIERPRKLLLKRSEIDKLERKMKEKGFTIIPYRIFNGERMFIKMEIVLAQGKKSFDKRDAIQERESNRELDRYKKMKNNEYMKE
jgi:SsrA-binding protein